MVTGRVVDLQSGAPLAGVVVGLDGFGPVTTDGIGAFQVPVPSAKTRITFARDGYCVLTRYLDGGIAADIGDVSLINTAPFNMELFLQIVRGSIVGGGQPVKAIFRITAPYPNIVMNRPNGNSHPDNACRNLIERINGIRSRVC